MIDERDNAKVSEALADFMEGCSALSGDIKNGQFDLENFENLKTIIEEYSACK